jgi:uncharacterized protein involved in cysteine biosynthesis
MQFVLKGTQLIYKNPELRRYLVKPLLWSIFLYIVISITSSTLAVGPLSGLLSRLDFIPDHLTIWIARILFFIGWSFIAGDSHTPNTLPGIGTVWSDAIRRLPLSLGIGILSFLLGIFGAGWLSIWPVGWLCLYDFTSPAYARRRTFYPAQKAAAKKLRYGMSFALTCGLISLFPLLNLVLLPGCVAGATLLVRANEDGVV